jgi:MFS family permease
MESELGWSRPDLLAGLSLGLLISGLAAPWVGATIDRRGGRELMSFGSLASAVLLLAWAQVGSLPLFYAVWVGLGLAQSLTLYEPCFAVLNRELGKDAARAVVLVTLVAGFASTVFIPLSHALVTSWGWRPALYGLAALHLLLCLPIHLGLPRDQRVFVPSTARHASSQAVRRPAFWGLLVSYMANGAIFSIVSFHGLPLFMERGISDSAAVGLMALIGPSQVLGRLSMLWSRGSFSPSRVGRITCLLLPVGLLALVLMPWALAAGFTFIVLYGISNGIATILRGTATAELLGQENFGAVNGMIATPTLIVLALSPSCAAYLWQTSGNNYQTVLLALLLAAVLSACAFWYATVSRPR